MLIFDQECCQSRQDEDGAEHVHQEQERQQDTHIGLELQR